MLAGSIFKMCILTSALFLNSFGSSAFLRSNCQLWNWCSLRSGSIQQPGLNGPLLEEWIHPQTESSCALLCAWKLSPGTKVQVFMIGFSFLSYIHFPQGSRLFWISSFLSPRCLPHNTGCTYDDIIHYLTLFPNACYIRLAGKFCEMAILYDLFAIAQSLVLECSLIPQINKEQGCPVWCVSTMFHRWLFLSSFPTVLFVYSRP